MFLSSMSNGEIIGNNLTTYDFNIPFKIEGSHFKQWQQNTLFFSTIRKVATILTDTPISEKIIDKAKKDKTTK